MPTIEQLEKLISAEPNDTFLNFGLAMELANAGRHNEAFTRFDRVIEIDADYHAAHYHKGNFLIGLQRIEEARTVLTAGLQATQRTHDTHAESEMRELLATIKT